MTLLEEIGAAAEGLVPRAPFEARIRGQVVTVTAVLGRTSVYQVASGERYTARHELVCPVEPVVFVSERNPGAESGKRGRARSAAANRGRRR